jgi:hypothetical protein
MGRSSFFAIAGRCGRRRHRLPRPRPPPSPDLVVPPPPPPPAPSLAHPFPPNNALLPRTPRDVLLAQRDANQSRVDHPRLSPPVRDVPALTMEGASLRSSPPPLAIFPFCPHLTCLPHHYCPPCPTGSPSSVDCYFHDRRGIANSLPLPLPFTFFYCQIECTVNDSPPSPLYHLMVVACCH